MPRSTPPGLKRGPLATNLAQALRQSGRLPTPRRPAGSSAPETDPRYDSIATTHLALATSNRYREGELIIYNSYSTGPAWDDPIHRLHLCPQHRRLATALWQVLFDATAGASHHYPHAIIISIELPAVFPHNTRLQCETVATIVAAEFHALLTGTAPSIH